MAGGVPGPPRPPACLTDGVSGQHRLPRRPGGDRSQLHGPRAGRASPPHRLRADVPRCRHARHRPRPARLHLPARATPTASSAASPPTATRTTSARCSFLLRELSFPIYGSPLTLGLARNRIEEAGLLGRTELVGGGRRRASRDRPLRRRVHPRHPLGPARVRHRRPHAPGRGPALRRLQARPDPGGRPAHRPRPHGRDRVVRGRPPPAGRLDQRRGARVRAQRATGRLGAPGAVRRPARPAHHHLQLRQPHPPHPADRRCRHRLRPGRGDARDVDEEERAPGPRPRRCSPSRTPRWSTSRRWTSSRRRRCASSRPVRRASPCRRSGSWPPATTAG